MEIDWIDFLVTPLVGALVGFGVWYFQSRFEALRRERERLHDDRRKVYTDVLEPFVRIFAGIKNPKNWGQNCGQELGSGMSIEF